MKFEDYEKNYAAYNEYAETVKTILEKAISEAKDVPRPQSIQCRAKSPDSLKPKLEARKKLDSNSIEDEIKDLAGARIIFYTNADVDNFLNSRLIGENFEVDRDAIRIHHPTEENDGVRYQAIHYTVQLKEDRAKLPEYIKFKGMRCEIQIQTILNHAWSETSHDIIYKDKSPKGFGTEAMEAIEKRFNQIMDKYLLPAGHEIQKVQYDFKRLQQGKELFDRDAIQSIKAAKNNNERYELLSSLKKYALPYYDDIPAIFNDLGDPLMSVVKAARTSDPETIKTPFGDIEGKSASEVTTLVLDIFNEYRYVDIERTFNAMCEIYRDETDADVRKHILASMERLAKFDLSVWKQAGAHVQLTLMDIIEKIKPEDRTAFRPALITTLKQILSPEISGTTWKADAVILHSASLTASKEIQNLRARAISLLLQLFKESNTDSQKKEIIYALQNAKRLPSQSEYKNELIALTITNAAIIVDFFAEQIPAMSYETLESLEHTLLYDYYRARGFATAENDRFECREHAENLMASIIAFRNKLNDDLQFVQYKTLVGFDSVFLPQWDDEEFDFQRVRDYRKEKLKEYVDSVTDEKEGEWYKLIERCVATVSDDLATFPILGEFLHELAKAKPAIMKKYLERNNKRLLDFLPGILTGLSESDLKTEYQTIFAQHLNAGEKLVGVARHLRHAPNASNKQIKDTLNKALVVKDEIAVMECLVVSIEKHKPPSQLPIEDVFMPALKYLTESKDARWINGVYFLPVAKEFFATLTSAHCNAVLTNLLSLSKIDYHSETILCYIAGQHPKMIWNFFGERIKRSEDSEDRYEAIPYEFHKLKESLSKNVELAVTSVRSWFRKGDSLFQFTGGRLLNCVFPAPPEPLVQKLMNMAENGTDEDIDFILDVLQTYKGEPELHPIIKAIINRLPKDDKRISNIEIALENTGVVGGEFGFVEAYRQKKEKITPWLNDPRPKVKEFATEYIKSLEQMIASEQRRAEQRKEQRRLEFDETDDAAE